MTLELSVLNGGPQTTIQASPRRGTRHLGIPWSGAADRLSQALANKLVGNALTATCLEVALAPFELEIPAGVTLALTGAPAPAMLGNRAISFHSTIHVGSANILKVHPPRQGVRIYLALAGELHADEFLGSQSTYLPARFGGYRGRALKSGDKLKLDRHATNPARLQTPQELKPAFANSWTLRATQGPDISGERLIDLFDRTYRVTTRADRTGVELEGAFPAFEQSASVRPSSSVWPGTLQLPNAGKGFLLLSDAQTTGGYPHILQVNRSDRHLIGQIRSKDRLRFLNRTPQQAAEDLRQKTKLIRTWLPGFDL